MIETKEQLRELFGWMVPKAKEIINICTDYEYKSSDFYDVAIEDADTVEIRYNLYSHCDGEDIVTFEVDIADFFKTTEELVQERQNKIDDLERIRIERAKQVEEYKKLQLEQKKFVEEQNKKSAEYKEYLRLKKQFENE